MDQFTLSGFGDEISERLDEQMDTMEGLGIRHIELRGVDGTNISSLTLEQGAQVRARMKARGFGASSLGSPIGKHGIREEFGPHLDKLKHTLELARVLEAPYIRLFSFFIPEGEDADIYRDEVLERMSRFCEAAKGSGVTLLHENEKGIYGDTPARCKIIADALCSPEFKLIFDPANFVQCGVQTYPEGFELLRAHIAYMHIKDARFSDRKVMPCGLGDGCVPEILRELKKSGFQGFLSLEPHLAYFTGLDKLEDGVQADNLPKCGADTFTIAFNALDRILKAL